jgi:TonB family protein
MRLNLSVNCLMAILSVCAMRARTQAQVTHGRDTRLNTPLQIGRDITPPRAVYNPDPEYSEKARKAQYEGTCVLSLVVDTDGKPEDVTVVTPLGMGLDERSIDAVRKWRFEPARKQGKPVAYQLQVGISFRLGGLEKALSPEQLARFKESQSRMRSQVYRVSDAQSPRTCWKSRYDQGAHAGPTVTVVDLAMEGDLSMAPADRDQIVQSARQRSYWGKPDEVAAQVAEIVKVARMNSGYFKAQAAGDAHLLTSSPVNERIAVTVKIDEGQQYRLQNISFRGNRSLTNVNALRNVFPVNDGELLDRAAVGRGLDNLRRVYREFGYLNATFVPDVEFHEGNKSASLNIDIDEGKQFYVSRIDILGLDESAFQNVTKELLVEPGAIYNERLVNLFLQRHASFIPADGSSEPRVSVQLDEKAGRVSIGYDFRRCQAN